MFTTVEKARRAGDDPANAETAASDYAGPERRRFVQATFDPVYVGRFVWRWRWLVAGTTALGLVFGTLVASTTPKTFLSTATVLLDPRDLKVVQNEVAPNALPSDATLALIESQTAVATSDRVLAEVIAKTGLAADPDFNGERQNGLASLLPLAAEPVVPAERQAHIKEALVSAVTVAREPKSFIISLSVKTFDADKSARIANVLADAFIAEIGRIQSDTARRATLALSSRLSELRRSVVEAEGKVEDYKTTNSLIGVAGRLVDDATITRVNDQLARTRAEIASLRVKAESLRRASVEDVLSGGLPEEANAEGLARLRQSYAEISQQLASLSAQLGTRHPRRIAVDSALASARESIRRELARIVAAGQTELQRAEATERDLSQQIEALKARQVQTSESFVKLRELEREVEASRAVYEAFLLRARETSEQESLNTANIRVISDATPPIHSSGPARKLIVAAGAIGGLMLGVGFLAGLAMLRLVVGFLRIDRRGGGERPIWTPQERARRQREGGMQKADAPAPAAADAAPDVPHFLSAGIGRISARVETDAAEMRSAPETDTANRSSSSASLERSALRETLRMLGTANGSRSVAERTPETERIEDELHAVRDALAELRQRRVQAEHRVSRSA